MLGPGLRDERRGTVRGDGGQTEGTRLAGHGTTDRAVPLHDARVLEREIRAAGNRRVTLREFPDVNHHFQRDPVGAREGYDRLPTQRLAPEVLDTLCAWLGKTLAAGQRGASPADLPAWQASRTDVVGLSEPR